jgi:DNA processing protein
MSGVSAYHWAMAVTDSRREAAVIVALRGTSSIPRLAPTDVRAVLERDRDPIEALRDSSDLVGQLTDFDEELRRAAGDIAAWRQSGLDVLFPFEGDFPRPLLQVYDYPPVVFGRGVHADDHDAVAIVGSRGAGKDSLRLAYETACLLAREGVTVISGLARGIDSAAHRGALDSGGRTVAVLGQGPGTPIYPKENAPLAREILSRNGQTLSQFWPGSPPTKQTFPMRNVTMSGLSAITAIVDAAEKSGTRHQAAAAVRHGRRLLLHVSVARETSWGKDLVERRLAESFTDARDCARIALGDLLATRSGSVFA